MCLDSKKIQKFGKPKNWIVGYKVLRWSNKSRCWRSQYSQQKWEFAEMVKAKAPGTTRFNGAHTTYYKKGIHAWISLRHTTVHYAHGDRIVKVLLFGVTHTDRIAYRADAAIIIEVVNRQGYRERW